MRAEIGVENGSGRSSGQVNAGDAGCGALHERGELAGIDADRWVRGTFERRHERRRLAVDPPHPQRAVFGVRSRRGGPQIDVDAATVPRERVAQHTIDLIARAVVIEEVVQLDVEKRVGPRIEHRRERGVGPAQQPLGREARHAERRVREHVL